MSATICYLEPDRPTRTSIGAILLHHNYTVTEIATPAALDTALYNLPHDILLSEWAIDGVTLGPLLTRVRARVHPPLIIGLTGVSAAERRQMASTEGVFAVLVKPCPIAELLQTIALAISARAGARRAP